MLRRPAPEVSIMVDVVIVGAGPAGLNAALVLGRMRRRVLLCDTGAGRNAASHAAHSVFTRDGTSPADLRRIGREQLAQYTSIEVCEVGVASASASGGGFEVVLADGTAVQSRKLLLASGMIDLLPDVDGIRALWGQGVYPCPYCDGWEHRDQPLAVYANGAAGVHMALLLSLLSDDVVLCTGAPAALTEDERGRLAAHRIAVREEPIARVEGRPHALEAIVFATGETLPRRALFLRARQRQHSDLPQQLGCAITEDGFVTVDGQGRTSVPGVSAAGDMTRMMQQVMVAAADGLVAASTLNAELLDDGAH
jgi:thioredoxin reductase